MYIQRIRRDHLKQKPITGVGFTAERFNLIILLTICILPQEIPRWPTHQAHDVQQRELFSQTHQHWKSILKSTKVTSRCASCSGAQQWVCSQKLCMRPLTNSSQTGASVLAAKFHIGFQIIQQTVASNYKTEKQQRPERWKQLTLSCEAIPHLLRPRIKKNESIITENAARPSLQPEHKPTAETVLKRCCSRSSESHDWSYLAKWKSDPQRVGARSPSGVQAVMA